MNLLLKSSRQNVVNFVIRHQTGFLFLRGLQQSVIKRCHWALSQIGYGITIQCRLVKAGWLPRHFGAQQDTRDKDSTDENFKTVKIAHHLRISTTNKWGSNALEAIKNQNPPATRISQITIHKDSGIKSDPNDWATEVGNPRYIQDLMLSNINVSVQMVGIVAGLPRLNLNKDINGY